MTAVRGVWLSDRAWFYLVLWFIGLNAFDLAMTLRTVELGAVELNPIMASFLDAGWAAAAAFKGVITLGVAAGLWFGRRHRIVRQAGVGFVGVFAVLRPTNW
jgi:hypothetical protein